MTICQKVIQNWVVLFKCNKYFPYKLFWCQIVCMLFRIVCFNNLNKSKPAFQVIQSEFYFKSENWTLWAPWKVTISLGTNKIMKLQSIKRSIFISFFFQCILGMCLHVPERDLHENPKSRVINCQKKFLCRTSYCVVTHSFKLSSVAVSLNNFKLNSKRCIFEAHNIWKTNDIFFFISNIQWGVKKNFKKSL